MALIKKPKKKVSRKIEYPEPVKITLAEENIFEGSWMAAGDYWLLQTGGMGFEILTDKQLHEQYTVS